MHLPRRTFTVTAAAVLSLSAAGTASASTSPDDETVARLVVADANSGLIAVIDSATGTFVASFDAAGPVRLGTDGHFVFAVDYDGDAVTVLDGGIDQESHGDHSHPVAEDPSLVGVLSGPEPAHVVSSGGYTAVFFDGAGRADLFPAGSFGDGDLTPELSVETGPHHGVAAVMSNHVLVTIPGPTPEGLPIGVEVRSADGATEATFAECPELHGEAVYEDRALFACADGVLVVTTDGELWQAMKLSYPTGASSEDRAWSFSHGHHDTLLSAAFGEQAVLLLDSASGDATVTDLNADVLSTAVVDGGAVAVTRDGELHIIGADGTVVGRGAVIDEVPATETAQDAPPPAIVVIDETAFVSDPAGAIVVVPLDEVIDVADRWPLDFAPGAMIVVG